MSAKVGAELTKAAAGTAANLALPGAGALAAAGIDLIWPENLQGEVAGELRAAIAAAQGQPMDSERGKRGEKRRAKKRQKKLAKGVAKNAQFAELMRPAADAGAAQTGAADPADPPVEVAKERPEEPSRRALTADFAQVARAQLAASIAPMPVPDSWQKRFASLLEAAAADGLDDPEDGPGWRGLLTGEEQGPKPEPIEVAAWSKLVTRIFAARILGNEALSPYARELQEQDRLAIQHALLLRLDGQRQALQIIAGVLVLAAIALGVDLST